MAWIDGGVIQTPLLVSPGLPLVSKNAKPKSVKLAHPGAEYNGI